MHKTKNKLTKAATLFHAHSRHNVLIPGEHEFTITIAP